MTEGKQVSNDNCRNKKTAKKMSKKPIDADVDKLYKNPLGEAGPEKSEVVHWNNFSPK